MPPLEGSYHEALDDIGKSPGRRGKNGKRFISPPQKPILTSSASIPEPLPSQLPPPEQVEVDQYLADFTARFTIDQLGKPSLKKVFSYLAVNQGKADRFKEDKPDPDFKLDQYLEFAKRSAEVQKELFNIITRLPNMESSNRQFSDKFATLLQLHFGNELTTIMRVISGGLGTVTLVDALDLLDEIRNPNSSFRIIIDVDHDLRNATDLEIFHRDQIYLFQIKTAQNQTAIEFPLTILDDDHPNFDWERKMIILKQQIAREKKIPLGNIHRILACLPPDPKQVHRYTGLIRSEAGNQLRKAIRTDLSTIGYPAKQ